VTLAGFMTELIGRVPRVGDTVEWESHRFTVLRASARRAERIEIRRVTLDAPGSAPPRKSDPDG
jgi:CBS domain containing-hemolysin-like protein